MLRHLFHQIYRVLYPNEGEDTNRKDPIYLRKLGQGDGAWSTRKAVIGWDLVTIAHLLCPPPTRRYKVAADLAAIPRVARTTSLLKWRKLLGIIQSITPAVSGSKGMFTRVQHAPKTSGGAARPNHNRRARKSRILERIILQPGRQDQPPPQVINFVPVFRFGGIHQAYLGGLGKGGTPNKVLSLWVLENPSHSCSRCISSPDP